MMLSRSAPAGLQRAQSATLTARAVVPSVALRHQRCGQRCCAVGPEGQEGPAAAEGTPASQAPQNPPKAPAPPPLLEKGQGTAIISGAISILFGVAYLALVQLMDMRGNELLPPPPEAFIP